MLVVHLPPYHSQCNHTELWLQVHWLYRSIPAVIVLIFVQHVDIWHQHGSISEILPSLAYQLLHWYCVWRCTKQWLLTPQTKHRWKTHGKFGWSLSFLMLEKGTVFSGAVLSALRTELQSYINFLTSLGRFYLIIHNEQFMFGI